MERRASSPSAPCSQIDQTLSPSLRLSKREEEEDDEKYLETALAKGRKEWGRSNIVLLGESRAGKTALVSSFLGRKSEKRDTTLISSRFTFSLLDFGGQIAVNILQSRILSKFGVYILLFNMEWLSTRSSKELKDESLVYLSNWLNLIAMMRNPKIGEDCLIYFVGTRKDVVMNPTEHLQISNLLAKAFSGNPVWPCVVKKQDLFFYPVNATAGDTEETAFQLLNNIEDSVEKSHYVHMERPISWFQAIDALKQASQKSHCLTYDEGRKLIVSSGIPDGKVPLFLNFMNEMGSLMWVDEDKLREIIVLDFIEYFIKPATISFSKHVPEAVDDVLQVLEMQRSLKRQYAKEYQEMTTRGIITEKLLQAILQSHSQYYLHLRQLLLKYGHLVPLMGLQVSGSTKERRLDITREQDQDLIYLCTGLLPEVRRMFSLIDGSISHQFYFLFTLLDELEEMTTISIDDCKRVGTLPVGVFEKLTNKVIIWLLNEGDILNRTVLYGCYKNAIEFTFGNQHFRLSIDPKTCLISVVVDGNNPAIIHQHLVFILTDIITETFKALKFVTILRYQFNEEIEYNNRGRPENEQAIMFISLTQIRSVVEKTTALSLNLSGRGLLSAQEAKRIYGPWVDSHSFEEDGSRRKPRRDSSIMLPSHIGSQKSFRELLEKKKLRFEEPLLVEAHHPVAGNNSPRLISLGTQEHLETKADIRKHVPILEWFPERAAKLTYSEPITQELHYDVIAKNRKGKIVAGKFFFNPPPGAILPAGTQKLSITFIPQDNLRYLSTSEDRFIEIEKKKPNVTWTYNGGNIIYLTPLPPTVFVGISCDIPGGMYEFSHSVGTILELGVHHIHAKYYPPEEHSNNYTFGYAKIIVEVSGTIVPLTWIFPIPDQFEEENLIKDEFDIKKMVKNRGLEDRGKEGCPIIYPDPLPSFLFCAKCLIHPIPGKSVEICEVEGEYEYSIKPGTILPAGFHSIDVTFFPSDRKKYHTSSATQRIYIYPNLLSMSWKKPYSIIDGEALDETILNCQVSPNPPGEMIYDPPMGAVLPLGTHTLRATYIPSEPANYLPEETSTEITIRNKKQLKINWFPPEDIIYTTPLSYEQLNATLFGYGANSKGKFVYNPDFGAILPVGEHKLSVEFISENVIFRNVSTSVQLKVTPCLSKLIWKQPDAIFEGESIYESVLSCECVNAIGEFKYSIERGSVLKAGNHRLTVHFYPYDHINFLENTAAVTLMVRERPKFQARLNWTHPFEQTVLEYGFALNSAVLCAKCTNFHGSFSYKPPLDTVLPAGEHDLFAYFTPEERHKCIGATVKSRIVIVKRTPLLIWQPSRGYNEQTRLYELEYGDKFHQENYLTAYTVVSESDSKRVFGDFIYTTKKGNRFIQKIIFNPTIKEEEKPKEDSEIDQEKLATQTTSNFALDCGEHIIRCVFIPHDLHNFESVETELSIFVTRGRPRLTWDITKISSSIITAPPPASPPPSISKSISSSSINTAKIEERARKLRKRRFVYPFSLNLLPRPITNDPTIKGRFEFYLITEERPDVIVSSPSKDLTDISTNSEEKEKQDDAPILPLSPEKDITEMRKRITLDSVIDAGDHRVIAQFYPEDINNFLCHSVEIEFEIIQAIPMIVWEPITTVTFGTVLTKYQHGNAYCTNVANPISGGQPGEFVYDPPMGTMVTIGLADQFNPIDELISKMKQLNEERANQIQQLQQQQLHGASSASESHHNSDMNAQAGGNNRILIESIAENYNASQHNTHYLKIEVSMTFVPYNLRNYKTASMKKELIIERKSANILWTVPYRLPYGAFLDEKIYNAALSEHDIMNIQSYHNINKDINLKKTRSQKSSIKRDLTTLGGSGFLKGTNLEKDDVSKREKAEIHYDDEDIDDDDDDEILYRLEYDPPLNTLLTFTQKEFMIKVAFIPLKNLIYFYNETIKILYIDIYPIPPKIIWKPKFTSLQEGNPLDKKFHCNAIVERSQLFPGELTYDPPIGELLAPGHYNIVCEYIPKIIENELPYKVSKHFEVVKKPPRIVLDKDPFTGKITVKRIYEGMADEKKSPPSSPKRRSQSPRHKIMSSSFSLPALSVPPPTDSEQKKIDFDQPSFILPLIEKNLNP